MITPNFDKLKGPQFTERHFQFHYPEYLKYINMKYPHISNFQERLYWEVHGLSEYPKCYCGNNVVFEGFRKGYRKYCSRKCMNSDPQKKAAVRATCMEKYGGPAPCSNPTIFAKMENTIQQRYGVRNVLQNNDIKTKVFEKIMQLYSGIGNGSKVLSKKQKQTMLEKYGVEYSSQCPEIIAKTIITNLERYGVSNPCLLNPYTNKHSSYESNIQQWLDEWGLDYEVGNRTIINPKELDIYIPAKNIAIEINGCYWHSDHEKPKDYHIKKFQECRDKNIHLIQIWEDWMVRTPDIVKSFLRAKLGICTQTLYARKCQIQEVDYDIAMRFLEENHIQGKCSSNYRIGLFHQNNLVAIMCFNKRSAVSGSKMIYNDEVELIRFCNLKDCRVIGGAGKLLKYYIKQFHPQSITSFSANDISNGQLYRSLGFESDLKISGSYWYIESRSFLRQHRSIYTRARIARKWPEYNINDKSWTERIVMDLKGYMRIYDSGTTKWTLNLTNK